MMTQKISAIDVSSIMPFADEDFDAMEIPKLPENPTEADVENFVNAHPQIKKVLRLFRGSITQIRRN